VLFSEVKCFPDVEDTTRELYIAVGQHIIYQAVVAELGDATPLYLTIPHSVYDTVFDSTIRHTIRDNNIRILVVNVETETIVE
jgi:hypothetical protein